MRLVKYAENALPRGAFVSENVRVEHKEAILKAMNYHFPAAKIILFGSRARGTHAQGADIDIAIDAGSPIKLREIARARATVENLPVSLEIDIVDLHNIPEELKQIILSEGIVSKA